MSRVSSELVRQARARYAKLERQRRDPRYWRVIGRFVVEGLLSTSDRTTPRRGAISVKSLALDCLPTRRLAAY